MPPADKRARKKENARAAREQREAAVQRRKRMRTARNVGIVVAIFVGVIVLLNVVGGSDKKAAPTTTTAGPTTTVPKVVADQKLDPTKTYSATITTNYGDIELAIDTKNAPKAAAHFITLARNGVYNGSRWHRVVKDFVIQGGAPNGNFHKKYGKSVVGELPKVRYHVGDVAAAKDDKAPRGTFDSQFFIVTGTHGVELPLDYADFARVTSGMDVVREIGALKTETSNAAARDVPTEKAAIDEITITER
jgi:cyclophilin family peptidyl-prolyl cis-trans isomerase